MPEQSKPRVPLGEPLSADELDALADITDADIAAAGALWEAEAAKPLKNLLKAQPDPQEGA